MFRWKCIFIKRKNIKRHFSLLSGKHVLQYLFNNSHSRANSHRIQFKAQTPMCKRLQFNHLHISLSLYHAFFGSLCKVNILPKDWQNPQNGLSKAHKARPIIFFIFSLHGPSYSCRTAPPNGSFSTFQSKCQGRSFVGRHADAFVRKLVCAFVHTCTSDSLIRAFVRKRIEKHFGNVLVISYTTVCEISLAERDRKGAF